MFNCKIRSIMNLNEQSEVSERNNQGGDPRHQGLDVILDPPSAMMSEFENSQAFHFANPSS